MIDLLQNAAILERTKNKSLANNFVTDLTSLLVVIDDGTRNFNAGDSLFYEI